MELVNCFEVESNLIHRNIQISNIMLRLIWYLTYYPPTACATAFNEAQEQDACVVGCQIQETSSTKQVKAMTPPTKIQSPLQRTTTAAHRKPEDGIVRPGGLFSTFSMMFSNLAGKFGQSMHKMWSYMTHRKSGWSQEGPGIVIFFKLYSIN